MSMDNALNRLETVIKTNETMEKLIKLDNELLNETDFEIRNKLFSKLEESIFK